MSIAISFLARTGIVLGTDSRVTINHSEGTMFHDSYPKLAQFGDLPIALSMVGVGSYAGRDFRSLVRETHHRWASDGADDKSVKGVADLFSSVVGDLAQAEHAKCTHDVDDPAHVGIMNVVIGGFSPGAVFGEMYELQFPSGKFVNEWGPGQNTMTWRGVADAVTTLWWGVEEGALHSACRDVAKTEIDEAKAAASEPVLDGEELAGSNADPAPSADAEAGAPPPDDAAQKAEEEAVETRARALREKISTGIRSKAAWGPERLTWSMPLSTAVDLVRFQLEVQIETERFLPGRARCGYPTQLLAISDSGLYWVEKPFQY